MPKAPTKIQPYQSLIEHPDMKPYPGVDRWMACLNVIVSQCYGLKLFIIVEYRLTHLKGVIRLSYGLIWFPRAILNLFI